MKQEDKELLLKDLSARLPYKVKCNVYNRIGTLTGVNDYGAEIDYGNGEDTTCEIQYCLPYLRPMSSMTDEEVNEYNQYWEEDRVDIMITGKRLEEMYKSKKFTLYMHPVVPMYRHILWLLKNHFDFMGLIPTGLACEAKEGMYNIK